ncbi:HFX_2341 family transcriptional regulator [Halalkalicoccus salilacus]|uniref:HFX_2341 family transcriptional regulator n=1 Tax=Halalkalicoccus salilacus TaxID=3117459 RepID=UPI00300F3514
MQTHVVPVGFDYDRLIAPLVRDQLDVDRVILLEGAVGSEANVEYSRRLSRKLEKDFRNLLGAETERLVLENVYDYDAAFEQAYRLIDAELDAGNEVWVNVSAMPRTVSFAVATAANSLMAEREDDRREVHTYYTAPEKYLETELAEELRREIDLLEDVRDDGVGPERIERRLDTVRELVDEFDERGTTIGAKEIDGRHIVELPIDSFSNVKPFEKLILFKLGEDGTFESVSELADALATELNEEYTDSFRSKVIYNVDRLGPGGKGYVEREPHGKSYRTRLSRIGELWVRAHADEE